VKIAVLKETAPGETRCAAIPETVKKFVGLGAEVAVEKGAGDGASVSDVDFESAGATMSDRKAKDALNNELHGTGFLNRNQVSGPPAWLRRRSARGWARRSIASAASWSSPT